MAQMRRFSACALTAILTLPGTWVLAQSGDPAVLQQKLNSQFKLTTTTADRTDIVTAGDIVQIHKPGVIMFGVDDPLPPTNVYKAGKIGQGFGTALSMTNRNTVQRRFVQEEKCWVTRIVVQNDSVVIDLYSDPYNDVRYYGTLKIPFPDKKAFPPVDSFLQTVAEVLTVVPQDNQGGQQATQPAAGAAPNPAQDGQPGPVPGQYASLGGARLLLLPSGSFTKFVGAGQGQGQYAVAGDALTLTFASTGFSQHLRIQPGGNLTDVNTRQVWTRTGDAPGDGPSSAASVAAQAPLPVIAPPPPPADAPPPTIAVGQTKEQVTAAFGQPVKAAKIGPKEIYYYKDMKVTFTNGKVSNVE